MSLFDDILNNTNDWISKYEKLKKEKHEAGINKKPDYTASHELPLTEYDDRIFPMEISLQMLFEMKLKVDLRDVRIHTGPQADRLVKSRGASSVTIGSDIYFGEGEYSPETRDGQKLIMHELAHVKQKKENRQMKYLEDIEALEHEADRIEHSTFSDAETSPVSTGKTDLKGFSESSTETIIKLNFKDGRTLAIPENQYEYLKTKVMERLEEKLEEDMYWQTEKNKKCTMSALISWIGGRS